jgi:hypothetical protein
LHAVLHNRTFLSATIGQPSTKRQNRYLEASCAKSAELPGVDSQYISPILVAYGLDLHILRIKLRFDGRHVGRY